VLIPADTSLPAIAAKTSRMLSSLKAWVQPGFAVHVSGISKDDPKEKLSVDLNLGPNATPGTYPWHSGDPTIGATVWLSKAPAPYVSQVFGLANAGAGVGMLEGSTTIKNPGPNDPPGEVRGSYRGNLAWLDKTQKYRYLTIYGDFDVSKQ
jgi:hypothetical protein